MVQVAGGALQAASGPWTVHGPRYTVHGKHRSNHESTKSDQFLQITSSSFVLSLFRDFVMSSWVFILYSLARHSPPKVDEDCCLLSSLAQRRPPQAERRRLYSLFDYGELRTAVGGHRSAVGADHGLHATSNLQQATCDKRRATGNMQFSLTRGYKGP